MALSWLSTGRAVLAAPNTLLRGSWRTLALGGARAFSAKPMALTASEDALRAKGVTITPSPFEGITLDATEAKDATAAWFEKALGDASRDWEADKRKGVWLKIPVEKAELVTAASKVGYTVHHAKDPYIMMTGWLPKGVKSSMPLFCNYSVGVAGFVMNDKGELLVIRERVNFTGGKEAPWKLPGGAGDPDEFIEKTAIREVWEETGIKTEFISLLAFRQLHGFRWNTSDMYFVCRLKPLTTEIVVDRNELADARWMPVQEYIDYSDKHGVTGMNAYLARLALNPKSRAHEWNGQDMSYHFRANKPYRLFSGAMEKSYCN